MRYLFNGFVFDSAQLLLSHQNEIVPCRPNEAKLLAMFLAEPTKVFSKDDILDRVWTGKVVSEQAVFQSISNLRGLLGEGAIKTFSKRGYQWQLDVERVEPSEVPAPPPSFAVDTVSTVGFSRPRTTWVFVVLATLVAGAAIFLYHLNRHPLAATRIAVLPLLMDAQSQDSPALQADLRDPLWNALLETGLFQAVAVKPDADYRDVFYMPEKYLPRFSQDTPGNPVLLGTVGERNGKVFVRYLLKNPSTQWLGELEADTPAQLTDKWLKHLTHITDPRFTTANATDPVLTNAQLKLLHNTYPDDLAILHRLAQSQLSLGDASNTLVLAEQLRDQAQQQRDGLYVGSALLVLGQALQQQRLLEESEQKLQQALIHFNAAKNYRMVSAVQVAIGRLALDTGSYAQTKVRSLLAMDSARLAKDFLLEVQLNTALAATALKFGHRQESELLLKQAEALLDTHKQSREHYALVYFYRGMNTKDPSTAEYNYRRVLATTPDVPGLWVTERAQAHLVQLLIDRAALAGRICGVRQLQPFRRDAKADAGKNPPCATGLEWGGGTYPCGVRAGEHRG